MEGLKCKIQDLLVSSFLCKEQRFEEKDEQVQMSVPIVADNVKYMLYSFDVRAKKGESGVFPFFKKNEGNCTMCDYILFCEDSHSQLYVLLVELKKGKESVTKQLAAGECFAKFVVDTLNRVRKSTLCPIYRKIAIRALHLKPKPKTKIKPVDYKGNVYTFKGHSFYLQEFLK